MNTAASSNPLGIDTQLRSQFTIFQNRRRKRLGEGDDPESGALQRQRSLLLHSSPPECSSSKVPRIVSKQPTRLELWYWVVVKLNNFSAESDATRTCGVS